MESFVPISILFNFSTYFKSLIASCFSTGSKGDAKNDLIFLSLFGSGKAKISGVSCLFSSILIDSKLLYFLGAPSLSTDASYIPV